MTKTTKLIIAIVAIIIIAGGVYMLLNKGNSKKANNAPAVTSNTEKTPEPTTPTTQAKITVDGAIAKLKASGLTVGEKQGAYYQMIDAINGDKVDVDGTNVEIYEFKTDQETQDGVTSLKGDDVTVFTKGTGVVLIHSTDPAVVTKIQNAL